MLLVHNTQVGGRSLMSIHLHVFARRDIGHLVSCSEDAAVATGIGNVLGNKGGVALSLRVRKECAPLPYSVAFTTIHCDTTIKRHHKICFCSSLTLLAQLHFQVAGARVLIVNSHLAAHDEFVDRRNADFHRICVGLPVPPRLGPNASLLLASSSSSGGFNTGGCIRGGASTAIEPTRGGTGSSSSSQVIAWLCIEICRWHYGNDVKHVIRHCIALLHL